MGPKLNSVTKKKAIKNYNNTQLLLRCKMFTNENKITVDLMADSIYCIKHTFPS